MSAAALAPSDAFGVFLPRKRGRRGAARPCAYRPFRSSPTLKLRFSRVSKVV